MQTLSSDNLFAPMGHGNLGFITGSHRDLMSLDDDIMSPATTPFKMSKVDVSTQTDIGSKEMAVAFDCAAIGMCEINLLTGLDLSNPDIILGTPEPKVPSKVAFKHPFKTGKRKLANMEDDASIEPKANTETKVLRRSTRERHSPLAWYEGQYKPLKKIF